ncbi:hypothetical protein F4781DRAFT_414623 [Annulohypoxylon bovei var. microspora]|nr:hypothetical protein F4781DRAFT_414623 [Annulohypoxylon bovei var. microspora]
MLQEYYLSSSQNISVPSPSRVSPLTALLVLVDTLCYRLTWAGGILQFATSQLL